MRIGILTHQYVNNFGAFLQAYSLQKTLEELFPEDEVSIINYINMRHFIINTGGWFRFYTKKENLQAWLQKIRLPATFAQERKKHMNLSRICLSAKDIEKLKLDYIIVGSDEVWNYNESKGNAKVKFGVGLDLEKLIAYAPSVGQTESHTIPDYVKSGISKFVAVSARDLLTEKLAGMILNEKIQRVVDPTFLFRMPVNPVKCVKQPYMLFYYCDGLAEEEKNKILEFAKSNNMSVYGAGECDKRYTDITVNITPFQWVWMFRNAKYVITGTFHGAVFSMLNHRQFACYLTNPSRVRKVSSLLEEFQLSDRKCKGKASDILETLNKEINYEVIETIFEQRRMDSRKFLIESIKGK